MNIKSGDTVFFNGISSTVTNTPFPIGDSSFIISIYNKYDGNIDVNSSEITLDP